MFIVSLAIADLIVGIIVMPISTVYIFTEKWIFGVVICQIWIGVDYIASTASILNLFILSLDRYWSVTSPLKYIRKRTKKRAFIMISIVWLLSSLWIIPVVGWHHFMFGGVRTVPDNVCDTEYAKDSVFKVLTACFNYYFPLAAMYVLYWRIFLEIRKRSEMELGQRNISDCNHYIPVNLSVDEDSERNIETFSGEQTMHDAILSSTLPENSERYELASMNDHTLNKVGYINMRYRKAKQNGTCSDRPVRKFHLQNDRCKVDYIYDEGVFDQNTEKVERFFYEEITPMPSLPKPNHLIINNNMGSLETPCSSPSTPLSSSGSNEDKRQRTMDREKYSLISGFRRLKEAENLNNTVNAENTKLFRTSPGTDERRMFVFRDERNRCSSNVLSIKDRVKNMRQSSSLRKEIKAARQLGVIMGAFTLCFLPYFILFTVVAFCDDCIDRGLFTAMTWVGYLNSTLNPFLYPLCNLNFRRKFRKMLSLSRHSSIRRTKPGSERNSTILGRYD
ncbi:hypothetical protein CHS0354_005250 [Potamilus streckersoni]|uniref:G-protein coupled receptors family 1 profile domain-containing protein n=1 Tax=Potamilus streckersoni TaxID=2493646 RepID=A0AAE0WF56_9BIVA|nr:hypothetical protein CHS0354_005250 [Potamilus streckersoni]